MDNKIGKALKAMIYVADIAIRAERCTQKPGARYINSFSQCS
jgi:hypothetical protein